MALAFIRVHLIRVYTFFPSEDLEKSSTLRVNFLHSQQENSYTENTEVKHRDSQRKSRLFLKLCVSLCLLCALCVPSFWLSG